MSSTRLTAADWQVVTEYIDVLKPLKTATLRLKGHVKGGFSSIANIILVFKVLLLKFKTTLQSYNAVNHEAHAEAPKDHLAINLRAAIVKARAYYNKLNDSLAYYAVTILHPQYKNFCDLVWTPE